MFLNLKSFDKTFLNKKRKIVVDYLLIYMFFNQGK